jgi:exodeoxyribonuclease VII small subunit
MGKAKSLENILEELNDIVIKMDNDELTLEETFKMYEQGIKLCKQCNEKIDKVEKQLEIMGGEE